VEKIRRRLLGLGDVNRQSQGWIIIGFCPSKDENLHIFFPMKRDNQLVPWTDAEKKSLNLESFKLFNTIVLIRTDFLLLFGKILEELDDP